MFTECVMAMRATRGHPRSSRLLLAPGGPAFLTPQGAGGGRGAGSEPWVCVQSVRGIEWPVWVPPGLITFPWLWDLPVLDPEEETEPEDPLSMPSGHADSTTTRSVFDVLNTVQNLQLKQPTLHLEQPFLVGLPSSWATDVEMGAQGE